MHAPHATFQLNLAEFFELLPVFFYLCIQFDDRDQNKYNI